MSRKSFAILLSLAFSTSLPSAPSTSVAKLSADEVVARNVAARGGLEAWRSVQTMSLKGKLGAGGNRQPTAVTFRGERASKVPVPPRQVEEAQLPFVMELMRPGKMRFELEFNGQTAIQVYDGTKGWKLRPYLNRKEVEPYTPDEMKSASAQSDLDGPLLDYAAKGTQIELAGMERVEGRDTYKLKLTMKNGQTTHVWVDAETFLEAKIEGAPRRLDGAPHPVEVYYRDYRAVNGLQIPFVLETKVLPAEKTSAPSTVPRRVESAIPTEKIVVEKVLVNPKLDEVLFTKQSLDAAAAPAKPAAPAAAKPAK